MKTIKTLYCKKSYDELYACSFEKGHFYKVDVSEVHMTIIDDSGEKLMFNIYSPFKKDVVPNHFITLTAV